MSFKLRFTQTARDDLLRLHDFLLKHDPEAANRARDAIRKALLLLQDFPYTCRKATTKSTFLRELVIQFGAAGYVALFEIEDEETVTILAVRHQREDDFH